MHTHNHTTTNTNTTQSHNSDDIKVAKTIEDTGTGTDMESGSDF
jgi:hypothetical protein